MHVTGLTNDAGLITFYDCLPTGLGGPPLAMDACLAWSSGADACPISECLGPDGGLDGVFAVCAFGLDASSPCACWSYDGPDMGHVSLNPTTCVCPTASDPPYQ